MMGIEKLQKQQGGFTIVEMIIVVIVIGIIVGITVVSYGTITRNSNEQSIKTDLRTVASQLSRYRADNGGYPASLETADIDNSSTISYTYTYGSVSDTYCLAAAGYNMNYYITSANSDAEEGETCPVMPE